PGASPAATGSGSAPAPQAASAIPPKVADAIVRNCRRVLRLHPPQASFCAAIFPGVCERRASPREMHSSDEIFAAMRFDVVAASREIQMRGARMCDVVHAGDRPCASRWSADYTRRRLLSQSGFFSLSPGVNTSAYGEPTPFCCKGVEEHALIR